MKHQKPTKVSSQFTPCFANEFATSLAELLTCLNSTHFKKRRNCNFLKM